MEFLTWIVKECEYNVKVYGQTLAGVESFTVASELYHGRKALGFFVVFRRGSAWSKHHPYLTFSLLLPEKGKK